MEFKEPFLAFLLTSLFLLLSDFHLDTRHPLLVNRSRVIISPFFFLLTILGFQVAEDLARLWLHIFHICFLLSHFNMFSGQTRLETAWNTLRQEAMEANQYLDKELEGPLEVAVESAGDGRSDGSTRRLVTTQA